MKGEPILDVPRGWELASLDAVTELNPRFEAAIRTDNPSVSFVPMPAVEAGTGIVDVSRTRRLEEVRKGYTHFREGDVLFAKITPCMENGKMAVVPSLENDLGFGSTEFHVLRPYEGISPQYIYYFVSSQQFRSPAQHNMTGAVGQRRVPASYLADQSVPIPPVYEQHRIVAKIEELFSELDKGVESLKTARRQLEVYRQAALKHAFEGKLTAQWREKNKDKLEPPEQLLVRIRRQRELHHQRQLEAWRTAVKEWEACNKRVSKPKKPTSPKPLAKFDESQYPKLPRLPSSWVWDKLGWMTCGVQYGTATKSLKSGMMPVLRMGNIQNGSFDWSDLVYTSNENEIADYLLRDDDVLFNRTNSPELVGKTAIYRGERPAIFAGYLIRVNQLREMVVSQYVNLFLNSDLARQYGDSVKTDGVNQSNINGAKLMNYPFPYCSVAEQREIVRLLDQALSIIDSTTAGINAEIKKAATFRQATLEKAFAGQLVVQDPSDESASILLEKIKAEKAQSDKSGAITGRTREAKITA